MELRQKIFGKLESLDAIVSPPPIIAEVSHLIDQRNASAAMLTRINIKDTNSGVRILNFADSTNFGNYREGTAVNRATEKIDRDFNKYIPLKAALCDLLAPEENVKSKEFNNLWQHILETAEAAGEIAKCINYSNVDEAFIAGLLHDIGWAFILRYFPQECDEVYRLSANSSLHIDAEREVLNTDHQEIGRFIAEQWKLPELLAQVMGNHHPVNVMEINKMPSLSIIVLVADCFSPTNYEYPSNIISNGHRISLLDTGRSMIGISMDEIKGICCNLPKKVLKNAAGSGLDPGDMVDYQSRANESLIELYLELAEATKERKELTGKFSKKDIPGSAETSLNIALAALSHYINNATMNISGQCEVLQMLCQSGDKDRVFAKIPPTVDLIKSSIRRISAVLQELSNLNRVEIIDYLSKSNNMNIKTGANSRLESSDVSS